MAGKTTYFDPVALTVPYKGLAKSSDINAINTAIDDAFNLLNTAAVITGGSINSTTIGAVSPSTIAATTLAVSGAATVPTASTDTNTTIIASTQFVLNQASDVSPVMDGSVAPGASERYSRNDHIHPSNTSKLDVSTASSTYAPLASPTLTGDPKAPTVVKTDDDTSIATTAHVKLVAADYAPLASPTLTGVPASTTAVAGTNTTQIATTAFVHTEVANVIDAAPAALNTLSELAASLGDDANYAATVTTALSLKSPLASPTFTGIPAAPTAIKTTDTTQLATTAHVKLVAADYAPLASPSITGVPTAPTATTDTDTTQLATTAFVLAQASDTTPVMDDTAAVVGTSERYTRGDHVHPINPVIQTNTDAAVASAAAALISENNAATSETNAATSYDEFDDRYLGDKASNPSLDNDGNALLTGALYWNTTDDEMRVYTGSVWYTAYLPAESAVVGPASAVDERVAVFDGTSGKLIKDGGKTIAEIEAAGGLSVDFVASGTLPNGMPVILNSDGTVEVVGEVVVPGGSTITAGTPTVFESATSYYTSVAMLTSTKAIVTYRDVGNSGYGTSCILDVSGSTITAGTPTVFESATSGFTSVAMLTSTKAIVTYSDEGNSGYGTSCILDVSGSTITAGTPTVFESATSYYTSVAMLTSTKAIVTYTDAGNSGYGTSCILDVSGSTITAGTPTVFESATSYYTLVAMLTSTKAIVTYRDVGNFSYGTSCILDVSGSTITTGTPTVFESATSTYISVAMLTSTKAIVTYRDAGNSDYGTSCILDVSGSTITAGTPTVFESANSDYTSVAMLTSTKAIVTYRDVGNFSYGTSCILDVSGSTITTGTPVVIDSADSTYISVAMLTSTKAIVTYRDAGNSDYGTSCILDNESIETNLTTSNFIGITDAAITDTESGSVTVRGGIPTNLTGLTIASDYYIQGDGTLATSAGDPSVVAGKAISTTSLILKGI